MTQHDAWSGRYIGGTARTTCPECGTTGTHTWYCTVNTTNHINHRAPQPTIERN